MSAWEGGAARCDAAIVRCSGVDERLWRQITAELDDPGLPGLLAVRRAARASDAKDWEAHAAGHRKHLTRLDRVEGAVLERFRRGAIGEAALDTELAAIHRERTAVRAQLATAERAQSALGEAGDRMATAAQIIGRLRSAIASTSPELRRSAVVALVVPDSVVIHRGDVECLLEIPTVPGTPVTGSADGAGRTADPSGAGPDGPA
jgi:hypothetical protein